MRILVAVDQKEHSVAAVQAVAARNWSPSTKILLLTSFPPCLDSTLNRSVSVDTRHQASHAIEFAAAQQLLQKSHLRLSKSALSSLDIDEIIIEADASDAIKQTAVEWQADLIVLGKRRLSLFKKLFDPSVGDAVLWEMPCSVMLARQTASSAADKVLIAFDGSSVSESAVETVLRRQWNPGSKFRLVAVVSELAEYLDWHRFTSLDCTTLAENGQSYEDWSFTRKLAKKSQSLRNQFGSQRVSLDLRRGKPPDEIVESAREWQADLIVVGSNARTGPARLLLGSVASYVASNAPCSVEVVAPYPVSKNRLLRSG